MTCPREGLTTEQFATACAALTLLEEPDLSPHVLVQSVIEAQSIVSFLTDLQYAAVSAEVAFRRTAREQATAWLDARVEGEQR